MQNLSLKYASVSGKLVTYMRQHTEIGFWLYAIIGKITDAYASTCGFHIVAYTMLYCYRMVIIRHHAENQ